MAASAVVEITEPAHTAQRVLVGLAGRGIQLSRTPAMHEAEGKAQNLACIYQLLDTDHTGSHSPELPDILTFAEFFGFNGLTITFPYKQEIIPLLDELSEAAESLGSVTTVVLRAGRRIGHTPTCGGSSKVTGMNWQTPGPTAFCCLGQAVPVPPLVMRCSTAA